MRDANAAISWRSPVAALRAHWPEYAMEGLELGLFMVSACLFGIALFHSSSPAVHMIGSMTTRRLLMGVAMGLTAIALIYSPMGQRSGAHMNPAVTLTYWRLGKIEIFDALCYIAAQFAGAALGMLLMSALVGDALRNPAVHYVATLPGMFGLALAWLGEFAIAMLLMLTILNVSNRKSIARYTGVFAGCLVAAYIFIEAPLSGMSMNPARTFGSSLAAQIWTGLWIYFTAPPLAMLFASELYLRFGHASGQAPVYCAKLNHFNTQRCIFRCRIHEMLQDESTEPRLACILEKVGSPAEDAQHTDRAASPARFRSTSPPQETLHFG